MGVTMEETMEETMAVTMELTGGRDYHLQVTIFSEI